MKIEHEPEPPTALHGVLEGVFIARTALLFGNYEECDAVLHAILAGHWNESCTYPEAIFAAEDGYDVITLTPELRLIESCPGCGVNHGYRHSPYCSYGKGYFYMHYESPDGEISSRCAECGAIKGAIHASNCPTLNSPLKLCGSFGCVLPRGHNRGKADVPENHSTKKEA